MKPMHTGAYAYRKSGLSIGALWGGTQIRTTDLFYIKYQYQLIFLSISILVIEHTVDI